MAMKRINNLFSDVGKKAKETLDKAKEATILAVDQNDDGKFDMEDVSVMADAVSDAVKKGATAVMESAEDARKKLDLKILRPVFPDTLLRPDFQVSKLIRVLDRNKKYAQSDVCQGSIGFLSDKGGLLVVNLFRDSLDAFRLSFYPNTNSEFYYVNPTDRDHYISLDEYFSYLKRVCVSELQHVAQSLGATHFRVTYKEECSSFSEVKGKTQVKAIYGNSVGEEHATSAKKYSAIDIAAEMSMDGHAPIEPKLVYLSNNIEVKDLIHLRMTTGDKFHHHRISIKMVSSSGIKENDAKKIDIALKGMKVSGNITVVNEVRNESRRHLEYEIDF